MSTSNPVLQSGLGSVKSVSRMDQNMFGYLMLAKVEKVHEKHNTVDVKLVRSNNRIRGSIAKEGRFACRVLSSNAGYDSTNRISYGIQEPLYKDQTVVVTFLDGMKDQPIVIGTLHDVDNSNNILTPTYPLQPENSLADLKDTRKFLRVFPLQDYFKIDGLGNLEFSMHSKSFISWSEDVNDDDTDFENLSEKLNNSSKTLQLPENYQDLYGNSFDTYSSSKNFLMVFRDSVDDSTSTKTKIFVDTTNDKGALRLSRYPSDNTMSYIELSSDGSIKLKRQLDSNKRDTNNGEYSEITISANGEITMTDSKGAEFSTSNGKTVINGDPVIINGINFSTHTHTCPECGATSGPH